MSRITQDQRRQAIGWLHAGEGPEIVANVFNCHVSTNYRLQERNRQAGSVSDGPRLGWPVVTTRAQIRAIVWNFRQNPCESAAEIACTTIGNNGRVINEHTVRRRPAAAGLRNRRPLRRLILTPQNRRIDWTMPEIAWTGEWTSGKKLSPLINASFALIQTSGGFGFGGVLANASTRTIFVKETAGEVKASWYGVRLPMDNR